MGETVQPLPGKGEEVWAQLGHRLSLASAEGMEVAGYKGRCTSLSSLQPHSWEVHVVSAEALRLIWKLFSTSAFVRNPAWDMVGSPPPYRP